MQIKLCCIFLMVLILFTACSAEKIAEPDELDQAASQIEEALPEEYKKISQTEVYDFVFSNDNDSTLVFHLCKTTYSESAPESISGLDIHAISAIFDAENTPVVKEFEVDGFPAAIYQGETCNYLCWTSSPEASGVLEYDPSVITEEDALHIVQSVYHIPQ